MEHRSVLVHQIAIVLTGERDSAAGLGRCLKIHNSSLRAERRRAEARMAAALLLTHICIGDT
jgi:hypothetical protein